MVATNLDEGGRLANHAQGVYRFYTVRLNRFEAPMDEYQGQMFMECTGALKVVNESGARNLRGMTEAIIEREKQVADEKEEEIIKEKKNKTAEKNQIHEEEKNPLAGKEEI
jgi:hypothetical protein